MDVRRTTLKDVAKACGVTLPTASKILGGNDASMADETIDRVKDTARRLGYRPHFAAKLLNGRRTGIVGIVFANAAAGDEDQNRLLALRLAARLQREGRSVFLQALGADPLEEILDLINRGCEAFVFIATPADPAAVEKAMADNAVSWVCVKGDMSRRVDSSYAEGVRQILAGWRARELRFRLLIETQDPEARDHWQYRHRFAGLQALFPAVSDGELFRRYVRPMAEHGDRETIFRAGYEATARMLDVENDVNALFYDTDLHALGGIRLLVERGLTPGVHVHLAGANNLELASRFGAWPFSSVGMDFAALEEAVALRLEGKGAFAQEIPPLIHHRSNQA
ncbi:MAG: LacI family DNA-binding transcriptional regulator [Spirochaetes bacterium]|nr:LacI family DNA-binding transcriptional regulator [Spirochaetota bacterium]